VCLEFSKKANENIETLRFDKFADEAKIVTRTLSLLMLTVHPFDLAKTLL